MGRKAKPIDLIVMDGKTHLTKEEIRTRRELEIRPDADGVECPEWLCEIGKKEWYRIEQDLIKLGLLTNLDVNQLAIYCDAYAKYIQATHEINQNGLLIERSSNTGSKNIVTNPYIQIANKYAELIKRYCEEFGLTPTSRAKLAIPKKDDASKDRLRGLL